MGGVTSVFKTATGEGKRAEEYSRQTRTSPADVVCTIHVNVTRSLFTWMFLDFLERLQGFPD